MVDVALELRRGGAEEANRIEEPQLLHIDRVFTSPVPSTPLTCRSIQGTPPSFWQLLCQFLTREDDGALPQEEDKKNCGPGHVGYKHPDLFRGDYPRFQSIISSKNSLNSSTPPA
jgi:hypothetical protein